MGLRASRGLLPGRGCKQLTAPVSQPTGKGAAALKIEQVSVSAGVLGRSAAEGWPGCGTVTVSFGATPRLSGRSRRAGARRPPPTSTDIVPRLLTAGKAGLRGALDVVCGITAVGLEVAGADGRVTLRPRVIPPASTCFVEATGRR